MVCSPWAMGHGGYWRPHGAIKMAPGPIRGVQYHEDSDLPQVAGEVLGGDFSPQWQGLTTLRTLREAIFDIWSPLPFMSSKMTELTESSLYAPPPSGILSQFSLPSMASSGHFDPTQIYDSYKAVEVLDPDFTKFLAKGKDCFEHYNPRSSKCHYCFIGKKPCRHTGKKSSNVRRYWWMTGSRQRDVARWTNDGGLIPVGGRPLYSSSEFPISRINSSDELDGEEVEVISHSVSHPSNSSPAKRFQSQVTPSTPRNFQPTLAKIPTSIPPASPHSSHTRPALNTAVIPSPIQQSINSPIVNCQKLQPVASTSRRRDKLSPLPFPATQVFQHRDQWPI
ncbi:hypothetical protein O181_056897 [Austropuccinia psidii MF-1]|uniref:Uncharacterized protein n=1 Tax=Austropuccinia psidii MF-1 TaxID=1389203 RepID=A0A9Q3HUW7_9BASI|nr:hypothetical protein [Austropuccinia psidii MF-1]